jgi:hypothetical protein
MWNVGVRPGDVLFEGIRDGYTYSGTAYVFPPRCNDSFPYQVSGNVSGNDLRVVLYGAAPVVNARCQITGYKSDTLVFTHMRTL